MSRTEGIDVELPKRAASRLRTKAVHRTGPHRRPASMDPVVLRELPSEEGEVLILAGFYGLALEDIATLLDRSVAAVEELLWHARESLRRLLQRTGGGPCAA